MHVMVLTYGLGSGHVTHSGRPNVVDDLPYLLLSSPLLRMIATTGAARWQNFAAVLLPPAPLPLVLEVRNVQWKSQGRGRSIRS
jgi:hypothetical protein